MLEDNKEKDDGRQNEDIIVLMDDMQDLKDAFDKVKVETTETEVAPNDETKVTTLKSKTTVSVTPEDFKQLQSVVDNLRTSFIQ